MNSIERPVVTQRPAESPPPVLDTPSYGPLAPPLFERDVSMDVLSRMLVDIERQNQSTLSINLHEIHAARERLEVLQRQLAAELKRALEAAQREREKKQGWFSRTFGSTIDLVAKVFAKQVELIKDTVVLPADVAVSFAKNFGDYEALLQSLKSDVMKLGESSETERAVAGFAAGTTRFLGDLVAFQLVLVTALARAESDDVSLKAALKQQSVELWNSLETNILENPDFWTVTNRVAQAAAVAGAFASGGALAPLAVTLLLALEADKRYGFIEDVVGKDAAPWVRLGCQVGATVCAGFGAHGSELLKWVQVSTSFAQGAGQVHQGVKQWQEGQRRSEELKRQADMQETLHSIQATQRLIEALIELYDDRTEHRTQTSDAGVSLVETHANTELTLVLQA